jgi:ABC-2 type transport system ATP-binding protein
MGEKSKLTLNLIETQGLVKTFYSVKALDQLSLKIPKGIAGLIGPNGAGKTTTINILLGLVKPNNGEATVFGLDCWRESYEIHHKIGILHEKSAYPKNFTGLRFLEYAAHFHCLSQPKQRAKEVLDEVGLAKAGDRRIETYSAGMARRLGLAQALIGDPELAILNEPTANVDPLGRIQLLNKIKELHKEHGTSFLISTHILPELEKVCDWIAIIDYGKTVNQGHIKDLAAKYSANIYKIEVSNPQLLCEKTQRMKNVKETWIEGESLYYKTDGSDEFFEELPKAVVELNLQLRSFHQVHNTLEEIYEAAVTRGKIER